MQERNPLTRLQYHRIFIAYLALVSVFLLYVGYLGVRIRDRWMMGDWVTNYAGGFVRRGLTGQAALALSHLPLHLTLYGWVFLLELLCYAIIFAAFLYLLRGIAWNLWMVFLIYSPATLSFTLLDPTFAFRKEILFLALLALIVVALSVGRPSLPVLAALLTIAMPALVLSHEGMFFFYPYLLGAFLIASRSVRSALLAAGPGAVTGGIACFFAARHPGTLALVDRVCASLGGSDLTYEPCSGAIIYMTKTAAAAHLDVLSAIQYWHLKLVMPFLLIMALAPVVFGLRKLHRALSLRFAWWSLVLCSALAWCCTLPLFVYAFDWNRWIYIHVFSSLMLMLMIERQRQADLPSELMGPAQQLPLFPARQPARAVAVLLLCVSAFGWQLSYYHHFPLPGDNIGTYLSRRLRGQVINKKLEWKRPPSTNP